LSIGYRKRWMNQLDTMPDERMPKQVLIYKPAGSWDGGRPWKLWNEWSRNKL